MDIFIYIFHSLLVVVLLFNFRIIRRINLKKKTWGKGIAKYCPKNKICWSISKTNKLIVYKELPSYGLERKEMPNEK
jgi:hypothetical protein